MSTNVKKSVPAKTGKRPADKMSRAQVFVYIVRSLLIAAVLVAVLAVFIKAKPDLDYKRALRLTKRGCADEALALLNKLEDRGYDAEKIAAGIDGVAEHALNAGNFDEADSVAAQVKDPAKKAEFIKRSTFLRAEAYAAEGRYDEATRAYYEVYDYEDAEDKYRVCRCAVALLNYEAGDIYGAIGILNGMPDLARNVRAAAILLTGSTEKANEMLAGGFFTQENIDSLLAEKQHASYLNALNALPVGRIAAGKGFTAAVTGDGRVQATGDNSKNVLKIADTENAVMVAAGTYHAAVLKKDGTVAAYGRDKEGQCDVFGWKDIVMIACSGYDTIGVKSDGSVVAAGMHKDEIEKWHDVTAVCGGAYTAACLNKNGTMTSTGVTAVLKDEGLLSVSVCGPAAAGIRPDGKLVTTIGNFPEWENIISVSLGNLGVFAIDADGNVHGYFYRATDAFGIDIGERAVEIEVSGTHLAVLGESGKVCCFGNNDSGQCNTESWNIK